MPDAIIIGGANGAGKTTFARQYLATAHPKAVYLNADEISREHPSFAKPVPEVDIRRRYQRGLNLFKDCYRHFADEWYHYSTDEKGTHLVASSQTT